jgi:hypothetical protein
MRARSTHLMMTLCLVACGAAPEPAPMKTPTADPHAWLEDIDGAPALEWVESQNTRTLTALQADPRNKQYNLQQCTTELMKLCGGNSNTVRVLFNQNACVSAPCVCVRNRSSAVQPTT